MPYFHRIVRFFHLLAIVIPQVFVFACRIICFMVFHICFSSMVSQTFILFIFYFTSSRNCLLFRALVTCTTSLLFYIWCLHFFSFAFFFLQLYFHFCLQHIVVTINFCTCFNFNIQNSFSKLTIHQYIIDYRFLFLLLISLVYQCICLCIKKVFVIIKLFCIL